MVFLFALGSCKKKEETKPAENAITSFLADESTITSGVRVRGAYELGVVFSSSVAGSITQIGSKMPEPGTYRVIIWDFDTRQLLRQKTIEQTAPDKLVLDNLDALAMTPNKKYVISINNQSAGTNKKYAVASKTSGGALMPFTKGSILVYNACYSEVSTPTFPVTNVTSELFGYPEFTFIAD